MRARVGKIARLPEPIREELNRRLLNGALGKHLAAWLNELPEVQKIVAEFFADRPISEHNISEWRLGGYQDWLRQIESRTRVIQITERCQDSDVRLGRQLENLMTAELTEAADRLHEMENGDARWKRLQRISRELCRLQMARCRGLEAQLQREKTRQGQSSGAGASRSLSNQKQYGGRGPDRLD